MLSAAEENKGFTLSVIHRCREDLYETDEVYLPGVTTDAITALVEYLPSSKESAFVMQSMRQP